jgi:hypothetical protein
MTGQWVSRLFYKPIFVELLFTTPINIVKWTTVYLDRLRGVGVIENLATGILHHEMFWTRKKVNDVSHCYVSMLMGVVNNSSTKIGL